MKKIQDPNKKHYFKKAPIDELYHRLETIKVNPKSPSVTIWEPGENEESAEKYRLIDGSKKENYLILKPVSKLLSLIMGSQKVGKKVLIKIPTDESELEHFFTGGTLNFNAESFSYRLNVEQEVMRSQKRKHIRLIASESIAIQIKLNEEVFAAYEISSGGASIVVTNDELERFQVGQILINSSLRFDRKNYHIPEIRIAIHEPHSPTETKIGFSFINLPKKTAEELALKIETELRGIEKKVIFDEALSKKPNVG